jgi:hypothetical protein
MRYRLFSDALPAIAGTHFMHLDADMIVCDPTALYELLGYASERAVLVQHPGFARPRGLAGWVFYMCNPKVLATDISSLLVHGALGAWENDRQSSAFVGRSSRRTYVCGGVWLAPKGVFIDLVQTLASAVETDFRAETVATWHDESHLNRWCTSNDYTLVGPEFCWAEQFPAIRPLRPKIIAVDKGLQRTR